MVPNSCEIQQPNCLRRWFFRYPADIPAASPARQLLPWNRHERIAPIWRGNWCFSLLKNAQTAPITSIAKLRYLNSRPFQSRLLSAVRSRTSSPKASTNSTRTEAPDRPDLCFDRPIRVFRHSIQPYQRLLSKNKCEVLITFMVDSINRWLTHPDPQIRSHIVETFGTDAPSTSPRALATVQLSSKTYTKNNSKKSAKFVRYFEMRDTNDRVVYYFSSPPIIPWGHLKMKEAMWKVDPLGGFTFSDSTNPNQQRPFLQSFTRTAR